jgi:uncharacterized protein YndB with AHSA1/START domain
MMANKPLMKIEKDLANNRLTITRAFKAEVTLVWRAWTESELLDQWWAPEPWRTETKYLNFSEGGHWIYAMVGPDNTRHFSRVDFIKIDPYSSFKSKDCF